MNNTPGEYFAKLFEFDTIPVRVPSLGNRSEPECIRSDQELHPEPLCFHLEGHLQPGTAMPSNDSVVCNGRQSSLEGGERECNDIYDDLVWLMTVHEDSCILQGTTAAVWFE